MLIINAINQTTLLDDQIKVGFNSNATDQFDPQYDANKIAGALTRHTLYSLNNGLWMGYNILPSIQQTNSVEVGFEPGVSGSYVFNFEGINSFDPTSYITLEDKKLNVFHDARSGDYNFVSDTADNWERFVLHFTPAAEISTTDQSCNIPGSIYVEQPGSAEWQYTLTDANGTTIGTGVLNQNSPVTVTAAPAGTYTLTLVDNNNYTVVKTITVSGTQPVNATATVSSNSVETTEEVIFTNTTPDAANTVWDFGDGTTATDSTATHSYATAGTYTITLTVTNVDGCTGTTTQTITVTEKIISNVNNTDEDKTIHIWSSANSVFVDFSKQSWVDAEIQIYNVLGQQLVNERFGSSTIYTTQIQNIHAAYVMIVVRNEGVVTTKKVVILNNR
jgi:PKD repeat protein